MTACIVGWAHTPFGKLAGETVESLIVKVASEALADAGIAAKDVDEIVLGHFNAGFSAQDFTASLVLQASPDLRFKRATRVENACATGSAAVHQGLKAIAAGSRAHRARRRRRADDDDARSGDRPQSAQGVLRARGSRHRRRLRRHFRQDRRRSISSAGATSRMRSPASPPRTTRTASAIPTRRSARISATNSAARRATRTRASPGRSSAPTARSVSDGAAALVLTDVETALKLNKAIVFRAAEHVQDFLPMSRRDILKFEGCARGLAARAGAGRHRACPICPSPRCTTASPSPN